MRVMRFIKREECEECRHKGTTEYALYSQIVQSTQNVLKRPYKEDVSEQTEQKDENTDAPKEMEKCCS